MPVTRERLRQLFGFTERPVVLVSCDAEARDGFVLERLQLRIGNIEVRGLLTRPDGPGPHPAILYGHSHGGVYHLGADELMIGREYLLEPLGPVLARAGYVTLCIDMPTFGARSDAKESSASKAQLWFGGSLIGDMLCDHAAALAYLLGRSDVDSARVGAFGMSMGCTLSYWLAAVDTRVAAVAHFSCFADLRTLIELGGHDGHGIYLIVPGLLNEADAGAIAGLIAPRPQLICVGDADGLTPPLGVDRAWAEATAGYAATPDQIELLREPGVKHQETRRMREAMLNFFARTLA
ncbi:MAG: dienelactone hydrolase family protein [Devosia sp.]